jgi:hypothetical protein
MNVESSAQRKIKCYIGITTLNVLHICTYTVTVKSQTKRGSLVHNEGLKEKYKQLSITAVAYHSMFLTICVKALQ